MRKGGREQCIFFLCFSYYEITFKTKLPCKSCLTTSSVDMITFYLSPPHNITHLHNDTTGTYDTSDILYSMHIEIDGLTTTLFV